MPGKGEIAAYVSAHGGAADKRAIARAFGIKGSEARIGLKRVLRELEDEGTVARRGGKLHRPGELPPVGVLQITGRDRDGELMAAPAEWDEEAHGSAPKVLIRLSRHGRGREPVPGVGDRVLARTERAPGEHGATHLGRVIKLLSRSAERVLGVYRPLKAGGGVVEPVDKKRLGRVLSVAPGEDGGAREGDLVAVEIEKSSRFGAPRARVRERLGSLASEKAVSLIAIHAHGIPDVFPPAVMAEAEAAEPATMAHREDWRRLPLVTIDPPDAKDHDDAVHAEPDTDPDNPGGHVVTVAIADVAWYVRPHSLLDREALKRGNSVYFPDRVVPMLPERISNDLCSLRPHVPRPALAIRMTIDAKGRKRSHSVHRIMMRSAARLSYEQAQAAIDGRPDEVTGPLLDPVLRPLWAAYGALKTARKAREPLDLDLPERKIVLDERGHVERVVVPPRLDAHRLIEEYMILANVAAAEVLIAAKTPLVFRVHDTPSLEKLASLREFLASLDISLPKSGNLRPANFNRILERVAGTDHAAVVNEVVLRSQAQAEYAADNYGHFGLNLRRYAHFTSPIRRYADLIVHRALIRARGLGPGGLPESITVEALNEVGAAISAAERRAMAAERETVDRLIAHYLADRVGATFSGRISGVTQAGLFVVLDETGASGFVPVATLGREYFSYDEGRRLMIGEDTGEAFRLGDAVEVKLVEAAPIAGALRFEVVSEGRHLAPPGRGKRGDRRARGRDRAGVRQGRR
ncbi:MAG TPA: ribonuclease R [Hyphomicrobiales bacterium]|nr:ribonuclease R [Hyphomicrobiales bacterium]